jgi:CMP-N-acetylneuraminic acid synthetase
MEKILGIIPARGGSKGIPDKNLKELAGKALLAYTADAARASGVIDRLVLSTDSEAIAELGKSLDIEVPFMRPAELAVDEAAMLPVLQHAVKELENDGWKAEIIVLLQPTSPLRKASHIRSAVEKLKNEDCDSVVSVVEIPDLFSPQKALREQEGQLQFWLDEGREIMRRQQLETAYAREGTVYVFWRDVLMEKDSIYGEKCLPLVLSDEESLNLDTTEDWQLAEAKLKYAR